MGRRSGFMPIETHNELFKPGHIKHTLLMAKKKNSIVIFLKKLGPGLITGAADDDPSGIVTYSQAGAQFGLSTLWTALLTFPLMATVQGMCARIGIVTQKGLTGTLKQYYPRWLLVSIIIISTPAIILNIGSDIAGMGAVANLLAPAISPIYFSVAFTLILVVCIIYWPYRRIVTVLKYLCLVMLVYLIVPFFAQADILSVLRHSIIPEFKMNKEFIGIIVAILGTTISPYLFFWQSTMEAEGARKKNSGTMIDKQLMNDVKKDVNTGMLFSNIVMYFIILTTGTVLFNNGIHKIDTVEQAANALKPVAGKLAYYLFALGVIGTGLLTIPVLCGSLSYIYSDSFGWKGNLDKPLKNAKSFYAVIIISLLLGLAINYLGISPIKALVYTAILYGITAPVLIALVIHIANNKVIMKKNVNTLKANILGWIAFGIMSVAALFLLYVTIF